MDGGRFYVKSTLRSKLFLLQIALKAALDKAFKTSGNGRSVIANRMTRGW